MPRPFEMPDGGGTEDSGDSHGGRGELTEMTDPRIMLRYSEMMLFFFSV